MLGYSYKGKNTLDTNQKLNEYRENCAVSEMRGEFPCDLSAFSVITIRRILSNVGQKVRQGKITLNYSYTKRTISFTIKLERP